LFNKNAYLRVDLQLNLYTAAMTKPQCTGICSRRVTSGYARTAAMSGNIA